MVRGQIRVLVPTVEVFWLSHCMLFESTITYLILKTQINGGLSLPSLTKWKHQRNQVLSASRIGRTVVQLWVEPRLFPGLVAAAQWCDGPQWTRTEQQQLCWVAMAPGHRYLLANDRWMLTGKRLPLFSSITLAVREACLQCSDLLKPKVMNYLFFNI